MEKKFKKLECQFSQIYTKDYQLEDRKTDKIGKSSKEQLIKKEKQMIYRMKQKNYTRKYTEKNKLVKFMQKKI